MNKQQAIEILSQHLSELKEKFGIKELFLFGSVARNEATKNSDIDLIANYGRAPTFRQYIGALLYFEDLLNCKVDLISQTAIRSEILPNIQQDLQRINHAT